jgi:hypothetical protein
MVQPGRGDNGITEGKFLDNRACLDLIKSHFDKLLDKGLARYGERASAMWMASLDTKTGRYPENDARPAEIGKRVYRSIDAPRGCSLYWDQPSIVAAHALSGITKDPRYASAANAYVRDFLDLSVARNGVFLWGNHYYYDAFRNSVVRFVSDEPPVPCDPATETGDLHEMRPLSPAWDSFWRISPEKTERAIREALKGHLINPQTGEFQRHASGKRGCAFLEAGGILIESLAWLFAKTGDKSLLEIAARIAQFSFSHRSPATGLLETNPTQTRWDKFAATSEVGLWANCLLRASQMAGRLSKTGQASARDDWREMALAALSSWIKHAYDEAQHKYYGKVAVADGSPILREKTTPYQPGDYCDIWEPLFPTHDYPMSVAEACVSGFSCTGQEKYLDAARRWSAIIQDNLPARQGRGAYAEQYGRSIHFLLRLGEISAETAHRDLAARVAQEAVGVLFAQDMFRGHPGEDRYDAVDGVGFLLLALMELSSGKAPDLMGSGW